MKERCNQGASSPAIDGVRCKARGQTNVSAGRLGTAQAAQNARRRGTYRRDSACAGWAAAPHARSGRTCSSQPSLGSYLQAGRWQRPCSRLSGSLRQAQWQCRRKRHRQAAAPAGPACASAPPRGSPATGLHAPLGSDPLLQLQVNVGLCTTHVEAGRGQGRAVSGMAGTGAHGRAWPPATQADPSACRQQRSAAQQAAHPGRCRPAVGCTSR